MKFHEDAMFMAIFLASNCTVCINITLQTQKTGAKIFAY
jgi:hypothetical protein